MTHLPASMTQSRRMVLLFGASGLGQLITVAAIPVLARLYDPAGFGFLAGIMCIVSLSASVVHGRYHMAIPASRDEGEAVALLVLAALLSAVVSPAAVLLVALTTGQNAGVTDSWLFVSVAITFTLVTALIDVFTYWRSHRQRFGVSAQNTVARAAITAGTQIALSPVSSIGLVGGAMTGALAALALSIRDVVRFDRRSLFWPSWKQLLGVARHYSGYPIFGMPQGLIAALSWNVLPLLLLHYSGVDSAGQYWLAYRLLIAPVALLNGSYRQATLPVMGRADRLSATRIARRHSLNLLLLAAIAAATVYLLGETLFALLLGEEWRLAGAMAAWLGIGITADIAKIPAICMLQSKAWHRSILVWETTIVAVRYGVMLPFLWHGDVLAAVAIFSLVGFLGWMSFCAYYLSGITNGGIGEAGMES